MADISNRLEAWIATKVQGFGGDPSAASALSMAWADAKAQAADDKGAVRALAVLLRQEGYAALLPALTEDLAKAMPGLAWAWIIAAENGADPEAQARLAGEVRTRFPGHAAGLRLATEAALASGRLDDAAALVKGVGRDNAGEDWVLAARIALAERDGDHATALEAGLTLAERKPKRPTGHLAVVGALRGLGRLDEADERAASLLALLPMSGAVAQAAAEIAEAREDYETALARWAEMRKRARGTPVSFLGALRCLRATRRMDLAMPVLYEALARFPDHEELLVIAARTAESAVQTEDADLFWQRVMKVCPGNADYALAAALCLIGSPAGRPARMPAVLQRLDAHHAAFPEFEEAYSAHIYAFRTAKKPALAVVASEDWCAKFPASVPLALARAGAFEDLGETDRALQEVRALRARVPANLDVEFALVRALSVAGHHDEADAACVAALIQHPANLRLLLERARISTRRGDWDQSLARLLEAQKVLPGNDKIEHELQQLRLQLAETTADVPDDAVSPNVMSRFESLGGTGVSCEFGILQRQLGADRVGLLRWSRNEVSHLLDALAVEFEGVGSEENTILKTARHSPDNEEYVTQDRRFFMESHTFVQTSDAPAEAFFRQTCRRLRFLRGKLLEDLRAAERIFVFKAHKPVSDEELVTLREALCRYGDNALLAVSRATAAHPQGTLRTVERGVYVGYVGHFMNDESGNAGSDIPAWQAVCAAAEALWRAASTADAMPALA